jgi:hypothetical protein
MYADTAMLVAVVLSYRVQLVEQVNFDSAVQHFNDSTCITMVVYN